MLAGLVWADGAKVSERPVRTPHVSLDDTLERARRGERSAFADLYDSLAPDVERLCRRLLGSEEDAQDARNEVFLRAHAKFARYDASQPFRRWLLAVGAHYCIDILRRRKLESRLFDFVELDANELPAAGPSPLRAALDRERRARLLRAIDELPERYRFPLVLRYYADLPYEAIAEMLDVSAAQVGTLLFRAKARLRQYAGTAGSEP